LPIGDDDEDSDDKISSKLKNFKKSSTESTASLDRIESNHDSKNTDVKNDVKQRSVVEKITIRDKISHRKLSWTTVNTLDIVEPLLRIVNSNHIVAGIFKEFLAPPKIDHDLMSASIQLYMESLIEFIPAVKKDESYSLFKTIRKMIKAPESIQLYGLLVHFVYWNLIHPTTRHAIKELKDNHCTTIHKGNHPSKSKSNRPSNGNNNWSLNNYGSTNKDFTNDHGGIEIDNDDDDVTEIFEDVDISSQLHERKKFKYEKLNELSVIHEDVAKQYLWNTSTNSINSLSDNIVSDNEQLNEDYNHLNNTTATTTNITTSNNKNNSIINNRNNLNVHISKDFSNSNSVGSYRNMNRSTNKAIGVMNNRGSNDVTTIQNDSNSIRTAESTEKNFLSTLSFAINDDNHEHHHDYKFHPSLSIDNNNRHQLGQNQYYHNASQDPSQNQGLRNQSSLKSMDSIDLTSINTVDTEESLSAFEKEQLFMQLEHCTVMLFNKMGKNRSSLVAGRQALISACHFIVDNILTTTYTWFASITNDDNDGRDDHKNKESIKISNVNPKKDDWSSHDSNRIDDNDNKRNKLSENKKRMVYLKELRKDSNLLKCITELNLRLRRLVHNGLSDIIDPARIYTSALLMNALKGPEQVHSIARHGCEKFYAVSVATKALLGGTKSSETRKFLEMGERNYTVLPGVEDRFIDKINYSDSLKHNNSMISNISKSKKINSTSRNISNNNHHNQHQYSNATNSGTINMNRQYVTATTSPTSTTAAAAVSIPIASKKSHRIYDIIRTTTTTPPPTTTTKTTVLPLTTALSTNNINQTKINNKNIKQVIHTNNSLRPSSHNTNTTTTNATINNNNNNNDDYNYNNNLLLYNVKSISISTAFKSLSKSVPSSPISNIKGRQFHHQNSMSSLEIQNILSDIDEVNIISNVDHTDKDNKLSDGNKNINDDDVKHRINDNFEKHQNNNSNNNNDNIINSNCNDNSNEVNTFDDNLKYRLRDTTGRLDFQNLFVCQPQNNFFPSMKTNYTINKTSSIDEHDKSNKSFTNHQRIDYIDSSHRHNHHLSSPMKPITTATMGDLNSITHNTSRDLNSITHNTSIDGHSITHNKSTQVRCFVDMILHHHHHHHHLYIGTINIESKDFIDGTHG